MDGGVWAEYKSVSSYGGKTVSPTVFTKPSPEIDFSLDKGKTQQFEFVMVQKGVQDGLNLHYVNTITTKGSNTFVGHETITVNDTQYRVCHFKSNYSTSGTTVMDKFGNLPTKSEIPIVTMSEDSYIAVDSGLPIKSISHHKDDGDTETIITSASINSAQVIG